MSNGQTLSGVVVDLEGNPVAGYTVSASLADSRSGFGLSRPKAGPPPWTETDAKGRFGLSNLPEKPLKLMVYKANPQGGTIHYPVSQNVKLNDKEIRIIVDPKLGSGIEDLEEQPEKEKPELSTYFLKFIDANKAAKKVKLLLDDDSDATVVVDARLNSIILSATAAEHKSVQALIAKLDTKGVLDSEKTARVAELIKSLHSDDGTERGRAAFQLGKMGPDAAAAVSDLTLLFGDLLAPIINPADDHATQLNSVAMKAMVQIGPAAVQPMIDLMRDSRARNDHRESAARVLGRIGDPRAIDPLIEALGDDHQGLRLFAGQALNKIGEPTLKKLVPVLNDPNPHLRLGVVRGLSGVKSPQTSSLLIAALGDEDKLVRRAAALGLHFRGDEQPVLEALIANRNDKDGSVRDQIYTILAYCKDPRLEEIFIKGLQDPHPPVTWRCAAGLGELHSKKALPLLMAALESTDESLRVNALSALGELGDKAALPTLLKLANSSQDQRTREKAGRAISEIMQAGLPAGEIAWGKAESGLELGLRCRTSGRPIYIGELVQVERIVRNSGTETRTFVWEEVRGPIATKLQDAWVLNTGDSSSGPAPARRTIELAPGAQAYLEMKSYRVGKLPEGAKSSVPVLQLEAGTHKLRTVFTASQQLTADQIVAGQKPRWTCSLMSGDITLTVRE